MVSILTCLSIVGAFFCFWLSNSSKKKARLIIIGILLLILAFGGMMSCVTGGNDNNSSWDNLSKEEKEWYNDNYGNKQYDNYKDAINDYKGY